MVVGLLGNESPDLNRFILVNPKSENDVRLQATIGNQNPTGLPVGAVRSKQRRDLFASVDPDVLENPWLLICWLLIMEKKLIHPIYFVD